MSVRTSPRRQVRLDLRRIPCNLGGRIHARRNGVCRDCGATRGPVTR